MGTSDHVKIVIIVAGIAIASIISILAAIHLLKPTNCASTPATELKPVMKAIRDEIEVEKPEGMVFDMAISVTDQITELYSPERHKMPWSSFDLDNMGPCSVYFGVNAWIDPQIALRAGQTQHIDLKKRGAIKRVYLRCDQGDSSTIALRIIK